MKRFDLGITQRLAIGFGAAAVLLAVLVVMSHHWTRRVADERQRQLSVLVPRADAADHLENAILYVGIAARNCVLDPSPSRLEQYASSVQRAHDEIGTLSRLPQDPDGAGLYGEISPLLERYERAANELVDAASRQQDVRPLEPPAARIREELLRVVWQYARLQRNKLDASRAGVTGAVERMDRAALGLGATLLLLLAATGVLTARAVRRPALALVAATRRVAAGDFDSARELAGSGSGRRRDELAELSRNFGRMAVDLRAREERLRANARLGSAMAASLDVAALCESGLEIVRGHLGGMLGAVHLAESTELRRARAVGAEDELVAVDALAGRAARRRSTVRLSDLEATASQAGQAGGSPLRDAVAVPLTVGGHLVGAIVVAGPQPIAADGIAFLESAATQMAVSIHNAQAHEQVERLVADLQASNEELQSQQEEIQAQNEELQSQQEEIQAQNEELQSQNEELQVQSDELQRQGDSLRTTVDTLAESEARYHGLFTHLSEAFTLNELVCDDSGRVVDFRFLAVNPAFERAMGLRREDVVGRTAMQVIPDLAPSRIGRYAELARSGGPIQFDEALGAEPRQFHAVAFRVGEGRIATLFLDVTDQRRAEEALRSADRNKNEFLAMLSHELRNPLAPIKNSVYVLKHAQPGSDQALRAQDVIERQADQLSRLVEDLLDVTRISRGKIQLRRTPVDLAHVVRQVAEDHRHAFDDGIELVVETPDRPVIVSGDPTRLAQVVGNLLQNAGKFTSPGGRVLLAVEPDGSSARLRVRDTGAGMSPETVARLFEPFMQADVDLARTRGGLGLGLALVKGLVEMHGGSVRATSDGPGTGSEFVVEIPADGQAHTEAAVSAPPLATTTGSGRRVLIVEDNADAAESLCEALRLCGHTVEIARRGADAVEAARAFRPEILLCDIGLPDMDGHEVARAFRRDPLLRSAYLIALSGYALPDDLRRASEAGFDEHVAKPPAIERLQAILSTAPVGRVRSGTGASN